MNTRKVKEIEKQARLLAAANMKADDEIKRVLWFPDAEEIRLIEVNDGVPKSAEKSIAPFYFASCPKVGLTVPSAIAMIRSSEEGSLGLPEGWGEWKEAKLIGGEE